MKKTFLLAVALMLMVAPSCTQRGAAAAQSEAQADSAKAKTYEVRTLPMGVTSKILETIEDEYEGEVVVYDLWATWCGPCRMAMKAIDSIKPALQKKGAKFVYITGETSPLATWQKMIPEIAGDHFRLTKEQWNTLCEEQGVRGIPCYKVVAKDGSAAFTNLTEGGFPGNEVIAPIVEKALKAEKPKKSDKK